MVRLRRRPTTDSPLATPCVVALLALAVASGVLRPAPLLAQEEEDDGPWSVEGEVGASLFFGASNQTTLTVRSATERHSELLEFSFGVGYAYGEGENPSTGESFVNKRSWSAETALDYRPEERVSPFVFGSAEGSLERQIDLRLSGGAGAKYSFIDSETARLDLSLAALAERTDPRADETPGAEPEEVVTTARWSTRFRARREFGEGRTVFNLVTFYRPAFGDMDDYTLEVDTSVAFSLNDSVALRVSLLDRYDSLAESRGAPSNNDGRFTVSLLAKAG